MATPTSSSAKFGTSTGVFTPTLLTILGVIMYVRLGGFEPLCRASPWGAPARGTDRGYDRRVGRAVREYFGSGRQRIEELTTRVAMGDVCLRCGSAHPHLPMVRFNTEDEYIRQRSHRDFFYLTRRESSRQAAAAP